MEEMLAEINSYISDMSSGGLPLTQSVLANIEYQIQRYRYDLNYYFYKNFRWQIRDYIHRALDGYFDEDMDNCFRICYNTILRLNELQTKINKQFSIDK